MDGAMRKKKEEKREENEEASRGSTRAGVLEAMKGSYQCKLGQGFLKGGVLGWMALNSHLLGGALTTKQEPSVDNAYYSVYVTKMFYELTLEQIVKE